MINDKLLKVSKEVLELTYGTESPFMAEYCQIMKSYSKTKAQNEVQKFDIWYQGVLSATQYGYLITPAAYYATIIVVEATSNRTDNMIMIARQAADNIGNTTEALIKQIKETKSREDVIRRMQKLDYTRTIPSGCGGAGSSC